jgi:hypothetical protein
MPRGVHLDGLSISGFSLQDLSPFGLLPMTWIRIFFKPVFAAVFASPEGKVGRRLSHLF